MEELLEEDNMQEFKLYVRQEPLKVFACDENRAKYDCISEEEENNIYSIRFKVINDHIGKIEMANSYKKDITILLNILDKLLKGKENFYTSNKIGIK
jgi:hypothetical protein